MPRVSHGSLHSVEISLYVTVLASAVLYSKYCLFKASKDYGNLLHPDDFAEGWAITGRQKDISDFEWHFWLSAASILLPGMVAHSVIGLLLSRTCPQYKAHFCLGFTLLFLLAFLGLRPVLFMICHCLVIYLCALTRSAILVWVGSLSILASLQFNSAFREWQLSHLSSDELYRDFIRVMCLMSNLRCISFGLECCGLGDAGNRKDRPVKSHSLLDMLVYNFYFPLFPNGPVITYDAFHKMFNRGAVAFTRPVVASLVWNSLTTLGWACFLELYLQFFYSSAISMETRIYRSLDAWTLTGVLYSHLNIFLVKYVVFYRGPGVCARLDNLDPPKPPRCVSSLYLFGDMWRYFDRGLYAWMKRYIYIPVGGSRRGVFVQLVASFSTFFFIWFWHGGYMYQMWWFVPNWLGIVAEAIGERVLQSAFVREKEAQLSAATSRRVRAAFGTLTIMALILSNLVFIAGAEPVWFYINKVFYTGFPLGPAALCAVMYCAVQINMELDRHRTEW